MAFFRIPIPITRPCDENGEACLIPKSELMELINANWYAVKVRTRAEALAHKLLTLKSVSCFLPTYEEKKFYSDRIKRVETPLFPGYLFCQVEPGQKLSVLNTPNVEYVLGYGETPTPIDAQEIAAIYRLTEERVARPHPYLRTGERVRIVRGPLCDLEGLLVNCPDRGRLVVISVDLLQRSISVKVDRDQVEPLSRSRFDPLSTSRIHVWTYKR